MNRKPYKFFKIILSFYAFVAFLSLLFQEPRIIIIVIPILGGFILSKELKKRQRKKLLNEILEHLCVGELSDLLSDYDDSVAVKSRQALENYNDLKYLKEYGSLDEIKERTKSKVDAGNAISDFLKHNDFEEMSQYEFVASQLNSYISQLEVLDFIVRVVYVTVAGNYKDERIIYISPSRIREIEEHPEYLMTKGEYNAFIKNQIKERVENKKHVLYDEVNAVIDYANRYNELLIVKSRIKEIDNLVQQLFDRTINSIQKIKQLESDEWGMIENFITSIDGQIRKIVNEDIKINKYYKSEEFAKLKRTCASLNLSRKEFNEYIEEKAESISKLFGTRIVREETKNEDVYNYVRSYKKSITPFTAEVSSTVFGSAENNPIDYIIKYFYPNKSQYKEQIQKLKTLIEELETLKEAKVIIEEYKKDYDSYIQSVPDYVLKYDEDGFYSRLGLATINESVLNVQYRFTYTSNGGMAQRSFTIPMTEENIIELITHLENKLSLQSLTREQRALMTVKLRSSIKERDNYTCCLCGNSIYKEPNLLLEVDHIIPIARGGLTKEDNLQTLCWKCNRTKAAKIYE